MTFNQQLALRFLSSSLCFLGSLPMKAIEILRSPSITDIDPTPSGELQFLSIGKSGVVYGIDENRVLKEFLESHSAEVELRAYQRLGSHPNIAKLMGIRQDGSIILERGEVLRTICRYPSAIEIPIQKKICWLIHAAEGYRHIHDCNIVHGDVGCNNIILTRTGGLKIIDFEGCSIDGQIAGSCYEWFSYRPSMPRVSRSTDIFAFGCAVYEIITGRPPNHELEKSDDPYREVEQLYANNCFPDVTSLPLSSLIWSCWHGNFNCMDEVVRELKALLDIS